MNNIKAIFMDLDGTVLTSEHKVSENLIKKLRELEEKGVKIISLHTSGHADEKDFDKLIKKVEKILVSFPRLTYYVFKQFSCLLFSGSRSSKKDPLPFLRA